MNLLNIPQRFYCQVEYAVRICFEQWTEDISLRCSRQNTSARPLLNADHESKISSDLRMALLKRQLFYFTLGEFSFCRCYRGLLRSCYLIHHATCSDFKSALHDKKKQRLLRRVIVSERKILLFKIDKPNEDLLKKLWGNTLSFSFNLYFVS